MTGMLVDKVLADASLSEGDALHLASLQGTALFTLFSAASKIREKFRGKKVDLCAIMNAKSGACS
ncbi:MAG TPA: hypothetical protein VN328_05880, partial [Thermodesulfovibrionales bacterium]|nr:hypothetical protein [Thermodesulfovibrionales bacterium]